MRVVVVAAVVAGVAVAVGVEAQSQGATIAATTTTAVAMEAVAVAVAVVVAVVASRSDEAEAAPMYVAWVACTAHTHSTRWEGFRAPRCETTRPGLYLPTQQVHWTPVPDDSADSLFRC